MKLIVLGKALRYPSLGRSMTSFRYAVELLRKNKPLSVSVLLAPKSIRTSLVVAHAFQQEIEHIRHVSGMAALFRLQWWRDTVNSLPSTTASHPSLVQQPLVRLLAQYSKGKEGAIVEQALKIIDSTEDSIRDNPVDLQSLFTLTTNTTGSAFKMSLFMGSGHPPDPKILQLAAHAGNVCGVAKVLHQLSTATSEHHIMLPTKSLDLHQVSKAEIFALSNMSEKTRSVAIAKISRIVRQIVDRTQQEHAICRKLLHQLPQKQRLFFLPLVPAARYIDRLDKAGCDPWHPNVSNLAGLEPVLGNLALGKARLLGRF